jgi:hypothetical protein
MYGHLLVDKYQPNSQSGKKDVLNKSQLCNIKDSNYRNKNVLADTGLPTLRTK